MHGFENLTITATKVTVLPMVIDLFHVIGLFLYHFKTYENL